jgi:hypothetical protein
VNSWKRKKKYIFGGRIRKLETSESIYSFRTDINNEN